MLIKAMTHSEREVFI